MNGISESNSESNHFGEKGMDLFIWCYAVVAKNNVVSLFIKSIEVRGRLCALC
jgi:hypothetical protein